MTGIMAAALTGCRKTCRILRHEGHLREADGAIQLEKLYEEYRRQESTVDLSDWTTEDVIEHF